MAAPTYATDLSANLIHACDAASASWTEPAAFADGAITLPETDYFIQNTGCLSKTMGNSASAVSGAIYNNGTGLTINSPNVVVMWLYFAAPNALASRANGGVRVFSGSSATAYYHFYVLGNDNYTYGGWKCIPVDPNLTADNTTGSPGTTKQYFGAAAVLSGANAVSKGNPFGIDAVRYGRMEARYSNGDSGAGGPATFAGFVTQNDLVANRWGLLQAVDGGYLWQGLMTFGYGGTAVYFVDSNRTILVADTIKVQSGFNKIEVRVATSTVSWTGITIQALGTTSKGAFEVIDNATVTMTNCTYIDMDTFVFKSGATQTITDSIFRRCGQVTQGGATISGAKFDRSTGTAALLVDDITKVTNSDFASSGTGHAVQGFSTAGDYNLSTLSFTGYASSDGSTGNEAIYVTATTGTVNLTVTGTPSVRSAGATVNKISGTVDATVTVTNTATPPVAIQSARVLAWVTNDANFFYQKTGLTLSGSGTTVTVTGHTGHGMATGDWIIVEGVANDDVYNGAYQITYISTSSYSYTTATITNGTPTGTIKVTYAVINAATNSSGQVTKTKAWTNNQPIAGRVRYYGNPYYQQGSFVGTIDNTKGLSVNVQLISDT